MEDYPESISVRSSEDLHNALPRTFQDAVKDLEGVNIYDQTGNGVDEVFSLRGFNRGSDAAFLVDGVRVNEVDGFDAVLPLIRMDNVDSVEIARGSSSASYGSGAFSGVVNIKTRQPSKKPFTFFGGTDVSSFHGIHFYDGVSGTIQDKLTPLRGGLGYYFNMGHEQNKGFRSNGD